MIKEKRIPLFCIISALFIALLMTGCANQTPEPLASSSPTPTSLPPSPTPTSIPPTAVPTEPARDHMEGVDANALYHDDLTNPESGWPDAKFDNYFIGYHEPEFYHVEVTSPNYKTTVFEPEKKSYGDVTIKVKAFTASSKTAETGDFSFGTVFRRSGDQYYAFAISQRTQKWYVLKSAPNALSILAEGTDESIHAVDAEDELRVDAQGANFSLSINDHLVSQVSDADFATGEVGFFVQTFDASPVHVHFDELTILPVEKVQAQVSAPGALYHDDLTNPESGWPDAKFDNYFIGYHEPEFYHVEVTSPNYKTTVFEPEKKSYGDVTIKVKAFTASSKTAETGDFSFGTVFRRSGDQYYAFAISQRTQKWYVLKSAPNALSILAEGTDESIHAVDAEDELRVDAQGANFSLSINDHLVSQVSDADFATGEVGFFVQTFDASPVHVHFDELTISNYEPTMVCVVKALFLNVRSGPGTAYSSSTFLSKGDIIEPLGHSEDGDWLLVAADGNGHQSWVFNSTGFLTCNVPVDTLPLSSPRGNTAVGASD